MNKFKRILITGGAGFIGSNFINRLLKETDSILFNIDKMSYSSDQYFVRDKLNEHNLRFKHYKIDLKNAKDILDAFKEADPDLVINFAAESHVDRSIDVPEKFVNTNILGTLNLLEHSRKYFRKSKNNNFRFLHISTDEVFGALGDFGKFNEETPYDPSSPYSASKAGSDHLVRAWNKTYALPTLITNCSNNYGPYQFPEKLIPLMIINAINGNPLPVYGAGKNIRDWLYVLDHCEAILTVLEKGKVGQTYNIGGGNEIKNLEVVEMICNVLDRLIPKKNSKSYKDLINFVEDRPGHDFRYAIDAQKINSKLGWYPKESFESGLEKTIKWYIENDEWWSSISKNKTHQKRLGIL